MLFSIYELPGLLLYSILISLILGASMGSFLNCAAYRIAHDMSFIKGRSFCPSCGHSLSALDLLPILSWLFLKGRCRYCGKKISVRYPLTEAFFAAMTILCLLKCDLTVECFRNWVFLCILFCLSLVDIESMIIPDSCHIVAVALWLVTSPFIMKSYIDFGLHILASVVVVLCMTIISIGMDSILGRDSMGGGDIKLYGASALYLGFVGILFTLFLSCLIGLFCIFIRKKMNPESGREFPFGPSIALATWIVLLFGDPIIKWYMHFIF